MQWEMSESAKEGNQSHRDQELINRFSEDDISLKSSSSVFGDLCLSYFLSIALVHVFLVSSVSSLTSLPQFYPSSNPTSLRLPG